MPRGRPPIAPKMRKHRNMTFRAHDDLWFRLTEAAANNSHSASAEIVARLEASFSAQETESLKDRLEKQIDRLEEMLKP